MDLAGSTARLLRYLEAKDDILLLTTSSRSEVDTWDTPKTTARDWGHPQADQLRAIWWEYFGRLRGLRK